MSDAKDKAAAEAAEKHAINEFKRSGAFDRIRKDTLHSWEASEDGTAFRQKLQQIVNAEVERDPSLMARDRGKAATLIGGSVERSQLYPDARAAAAKKIFASEDFKTRIYDSLKQYFPKKEEMQNGDSQASTSTVIENEKKEQKTTKTAQEAAMEFIKREEGG